MRISTMQMYERGVNGILENQLKLSRTQMELATGRRILSPSDDPSGSAAALDVTQALETTRQYIDNAHAARSRLTLEEGTLASITDALQRVRELAVQGNNDSQTPETRRYLAAEIRARYQELLALANTRDANNEYLFAGFQGSVRPFTVNSSGVVSYNGDQGSRFVQISPTTQVATGDSGSAVFLEAVNGNGTFVSSANSANTGTGIIGPGSVSGAFVPDTYTITFTQLLPTDPITYEVTGAVSGVVVPAGTPYVDGADIAFNGVRTGITGTPANGDSFTVAPSANQSVFETVQDLIGAMENSAGGGAQLAQFHNAMNRALTDIDQAMSNIVEIRAQTGARLNTIDSQASANDAFVVNLEQTLSDIQDLDYAEAASRLQRQLLSLEAAQKSYVSIQSLSLFSFLR
jgi:flagellar hook-associated protein 3 FlgL